jgi:hypothetical protein
VSPDTVKRDWRLAKLWLLRELEGQRARESRGRDDLDDSRSIRASTCSTTGAGNRSIAVGAFSGNAG